MNNKNLIPVFYVITFIILILGTIFKILHQPLGAEILGLAFISSIIFIVLALIEIFKSDRINIIEKIMWLVGFIFLSTVAGFIYLVSARKRILRDYKFNI